MGYRWPGDRWVLVPASLGGWWLLGSNGDHIRVEGLRRVDSFGPWQRVDELYASFDRLERNDDWYRDSRDNKEVSLFILLLGLPLAWLPALLIFVAMRLGRRSAGVRLAPCAIVVSVLYLLIAPFFVGAFWAMTTRL